MHTMRQAHRGQTRPQRSQPARLRVLRYYCHPRRHRTVDGSICVGVHSPVERVRVPAALVKTRMKGAEMSLRIGALAYLFKLRILKLRFELRERELYEK
jgi:hypothetical protein